MSNPCRWAPVALALGLAGLAGCGDSNSPVTPRPVARVTIVGGGEPLQLGQSVALEAVLTSADGAVLSGRTVTWSSSDTARVRLSAGGVALAWRAGRADIIATAEGKADTLELQALAPRLDGTQYRLARLAGQSSPFLLTDRTTGDGTRLRHWIVSDSLAFLADGRLAHLRQHRWSEIPPGGPEDVYEDFEGGGGFYRQDEGNVAVAWNYITPPPAEAFTDTLRLRGDGLVRRMKLPPACLTCPPGAEVELLYLEDES